MLIERTQKYSWRPLGWDYPAFNNTTTIQFGRGKLPGSLQRWTANGNRLSNVGGSAEILRYQRWPQQQKVSIWETTEQIDIVLFYEIHPLSFPTLAPTHSSEGFIDPHNVCSFSCTLAEPSSMHRLCVVPHSQIAYHILKPEPLCLTHFLWMTCEVQWSFDDGLSSFQLCHFTTL